MGVTRIREQYALDLLLMALLRPHRFVAILFWRALGKRMRARGQLDTALARLPFAMERIMRRDGKADLALIASAPAAAREIGLCVHLHLDKDCSVSNARRAIKSIVSQSHAPMRVFLTRSVNGAHQAIVSESATELNQAFSSRITALHAALVEARKVGARWIVPYSTASTLTPYALAAYSAHLLSKSEADMPAIIYGDTRENAPSAARRGYWLKPEWDPRMFLSQDYVSQGCALSVENALAVLENRPVEAVGEGGPGSLFELLLSMSQEDAVEHVPRTVANSRDIVWSGPDEARTDAVAKVLDGKGTLAAGPFGTTRVRWSLSDPLPTVSVIVPTRDRVELLRTCVEGVLDQTDYPALDLIIADNGSVEPETLAYFDRVAADPRVQVMHWPHPFNYSAINNFVARNAKGEYLCLLNNDIEVIEPHWLTEMMREAIQPGVGAVGARLLYPDRSIQHAGVAIGIGNAAGHAHRGLREGEPGYFAQALIARGASAVTAACLVVRKDCFDEVGGLDEEALAVAYNDVDLCLKLQALGLANIYTPLSTLIHHESKSRGQDFAPEHVERYSRELAAFQERWNTTRAVDPWHHSRLARGEEVYSIG